MCMCAYFYMFQSFFVFCESSVPGCLRLILGVHVHDLSDSALVGDFKGEF